MENGVIKIGGDYSGFTAASKNAMTQAQRDSKTFVDAAEREMKRLDSAYDSIAAHERQVKSTLELDIQRLKASGRDSEIKHIESVLSYKKKVADYEKLGFSPIQAASMSMQSLRYEDQIAAKQKAVELAKNIETSQASLNAQKLRELETAKQIAEKQASIASSNAKEQAAMQKKIQLMAAVASGDKQREQHLRAMATLERNVQAGLNAGMKPSEALQQARTMLRLEQSISQEKQKQQSIGGGPGGAAYAGARRGSAFSGGQNAAYRTGMISQQAQDVAVSLQMGMSASRVIAQQGSQIASIFGPKGMVIGGVIAIGAAIIEWAFNTKKANEQAQEYKKLQEEIGATIERNTKLHIENQSAIATLRGGGIAGKAVEEEMEFELKQIEIRKKRNKVEDEIKSRKSAQSGWGWGARDFSQTNEQKRELQALDEEEYLLAQKINASRESARRKRNTDTDISIIKTEQEISLMGEMSEAAKKGASDYYDFVNSLKDIELSENSDYNKYALSAAAENLYAAKLEAAERAKSNKDLDNSAAIKMRSEAIDNETKLLEQGATHAEKLLSLSLRIQNLNKEKQSGGMTERRSDEIRLELSKLEIERSAQIKGASDDIVKKANEEYDLAEKMSAITNRDASTRLQVLRAEKDLLEKKIAWTPNEVALLNAKKRQLDEDIRQQQVNGLIAAGGAGMGIVAQQRAADKAQERARKRAEGNLGLGNIRRGLGGEIIGGVNLDPNSGKVGDNVGPEEIARRRKLLGVNDRAGGLPIPATAVFTKDQIKEISDSISLAIIAITTR